jgi:hypothetical protein
MRWLVERIHREVIHHEMPRASVLNLFGNEAVEKPKQGKNLP